MRTQNLTGNIFVFGDKGKSELVNDYLKSNKDNFKEILCVAPYNDYSNLLDKNQIIKGFNMVKVNDFIVNLKKIRKTESKPDPRLVVLDINNTDYTSILRNVLLNSDYLNLTVVLTSNITKYPLDIRSSVNYVLLTHLNKKKLPHIWINFCSCTSDIPDYQSFYDYIKKSKSNVHILDRKQDQLEKYEFYIDGTWAWLLSTVGY